MAAALEVAERSQRESRSVTCRLFEAGPAFGGKIVTHRVQGCVIEAGPDSFISQKPAALDLCRRLGLGDQLINTNQEHRKAFVYSRGALRELPEGMVVITPGNIGPFLKSGLLSWTGLARMGLEYILPPRRSSADESLAGFFRRRFGAEATARFIEPLMAGIHAGDAEQMSVAATFPRFRELEQAQGSVIRGLVAASKKAAARQSSGPRPSLFVTLKNGLADLVDAVVTKLGAAGVELRAGCGVDSVRVRSKEVGRWVYDLHLSDGTVCTADAVVIATPAFAAAELIRPLSPSAAGILDHIPYASTATISMLYPAAQVRAQIEGFGFVVPRIEQRSLLAATWTSLKWSHRAPEDKVLVRCYVGGIGREAMLAQPDQALVAQSQEELAQLAGVRGAPEYVEVNRWERAMPQYLVGHLDRVAAVDTALSRFPGVLLTGAAYRGVGIPDCIRDGQEAAARAFDVLSCPNASPHA